MPRRPWPLVAVALSLASCAAGGIEQLPGGPDASLSFDAAPPDAAIVMPADAAFPDAPILPDAPPPPDARPPADAPVDAGPADARPPDGRPGDAGPDANLPDAACRVEIVENGSFDLSTGTGEQKEIAPWINVIVVGQRTMLVATAAELQAVGADVHAGGYAARLGGENNADHALYTTFMVPQGTRDLVLTGQFWVTSGEGTTELDDLFHIRLLDENGELLEEIGVLTEANKGTAYGGRTFSPVSPYAGRLLTLALAATTNDSLPTDFYVDSLKLEALFCQ